MTAPEPEQSAPAPRAKRRRWPVVVATLIIVPLLLFAVYTFFVVSWSYSDGERAGTLQKFSRKGWMCKTYEGELALSPLLQAPRHGHLAHGDAGAELDAEAPVRQVRALRHRTHDEGAVEALQK